MNLRPVTLREANEVIEKWHSHHPKVKTKIFGVGAEHEGEVVGVVVVERPIARMLTDGYTCEVSRLCTNGHKNAASFLLGAVTRAARALGYRRVVSYTRTDELGTCYKAANWRPVAMTKPEAWDRRNATGTLFLPGFYTPNTETVARVRWEWAA